MTFDLLTGQDIGVPSSIQRPLLQQNFAPLIDLSDDNSSVADSDKSSSNLKLHAADNNDKVDADDNNDDGDEWVITSSMINDQDKDIQRHNTQNTQLSGHNSINIDQVHLQMVSYFKSDKYKQYFTYWIETSDKKTREFSIVSFDRQLRLRRTGFILGERLRPLHLLWLIKTYPPPQEVVTVFIEICTIASNTSKDEMTQEISGMEQQPLYNTLIKYLSNNFLKDGYFLNNDLAAIGHLLSCGLPDRLFPRLTSFRDLIRAKNIYMIQTFDHCRMSNNKKQALHNILNYSQPTGHAYVCGFIMCMFLMAIAKGRPLLDISFMDYDTTQMTFYQRDLFINNNA